MLKKTSFPRFFINWRTFSLEALLLGDDCKGGTSWWCSTKTTPSHCGSADAVYEEECSRVHQVLRWRQPLNWDTANNEWSNMAPRTDHETILRLIPGWRDLWAGTTNGSGIGVQSSRSLVENRFPSSTWASQTVQGALMFLLWTPECEWNESSPCWRPSRWQSLSSAASPVGPNTSPAPPVSPLPASGKAPLKGQGSRKHSSGAGTSLHDPQLITTTLNTAQIQFAASHNEGVIQKITLRWTFSSES